eukprot:TRINITY_DN5643_c0_g1_i1.p1 TRINITY_DN5643_c0_g1~~TRINITY_DN5643_c0_g1_i1.p1  ORF type:complete len:398 (+),score=58.93 TRINITY_DN5643_c0_g1_i1:147-1196(+)
MTVPGTMENYSQTSFPMVGVGGEVYFNAEYGKDGSAIIVCSGGSCVVGANGSADIVGGSPHCFINETGVVCDERIVASANSQGVYSAIKDGVAYPPSLTAFHGTSTNPQYSEGIYYVNGTDNKMMASLATKPFPSFPDAELDYFGTPDMDVRGQAAFFASHTADDDAVHAGIFYWSIYGLQLLFESGVTKVPTTGNTFAGFTDPVVCGNTVSVVASYPDGKGVFTYDLGSKQIRKIAALGDNANPQDTFQDFPFPPACTPDGTLLLFYADAGTSADPTHSSGIYVQSLNTTTHAPLITAADRVNGARFGLPPKVASHAVLQTGPNAYRTGFFAVLDDKTFGVWEVDFTM